MNYVKYLDILGVDTIQIPCIELHGVPNTATVGAVGLFGIDVTSEGREIYVCTDVKGAIYTWLPLPKGKDGSCVVKAEINDIDELILTLSDGKTINAGVVKGKDGANGKDGNDGVSVSSVELNTDGELIISLSNGTTTNVGKVKGATGNDGVSITKVEMNASYELLVTLSNDTVMNLGTLGSVTSATLNDSGELEIMFSTGDVINVGKVQPTIQDFVGTQPLGKYSSIYYDGEKFVEKPITLENASWESIAEISESGKASEYFSVGDEKDIELATGEKITLVILGFNHDYADFSKKIPVGITFGMKNLLATKYYIQKGHNKWAYTTMYMSILPTLYSHLPSDLKSVIKTTYKEARLSASVGTYSKYEHQLFLFSPTELGLSDTLSGNDGRRYDYYNSNGATKRQKKLSNGLGDVSNWWTRLESANDSAYTVILTDGTKSEISASTEEGICFGFGI